jgi:hypothetical protein
MSKGKLSMVSEQEFKGVASQRYDPSKIPAGYYSSDQNGSRDLMRGGWTHRKGYTRMCRTTRGSILRESFPITAIFQFTPAVAVNAFIRNSTTKTPFARALVVSSNGTIVGHDMLDPRYPFSS